MKTILTVKEVDNLESIKGGDIERADGKAAQKSLANVKAKYPKLKHVRGLGGTLFRLPQEGKFAVIVRCNAKGCNTATLIRTQDLFQVRKCSHCRSKKGGE